MFTTTSGIVLKTYPFRDKKIIAKVYTEQCGLMSFIVQKNKSQSMLSELLTIAEITYKNSASQSLIYIKEARVEYVYKSLTTNGSKIQSAVVLCEILNKCVNETNKKLYNFIIKSFTFLDHSQAVPSGFNNFFLLKFCDIIGIKPLKDNVDNVDNMVLNMAEGCFKKYNPSEKNKFLVPRKESEEIYKLSLLDFSNLINSNIDPNLEFRVFNYLISYVSLHVSDLTNLKSIKIFKELVC